METRASYLLVGGFVLVLMAGLIFFVAWFARGGFGEEQTRYYVYFTESVSGLSSGSAVRFRGVRVGTVTDIVIDPDNMTRIRVTLEMREDTPIKTDSVASLEVEGITGGAFINIQGGTQESPRLRPEEGEDVAVIPSKPSALRSLVATAPALMNNLLELTERAERLLSDENQRAVTEILVNVLALAEALAESADQINGTVTETRSAVENINGLVVALRERSDALTASAESALRSADGAFATIGGQAERIGGEVELTAADARDLIASLDKSARDISDMVRELREPIQLFADEGLFELTALIAELRQLTGKVSRLTTEIERRPADFLFGEGRGGVEID